MARTIVRASARVTADILRSCDWPTCTVQSGLVPFQKLTSKKVFHHCQQHHEAILVILRQRANG